MLLFLLLVLVFLAIITAVCGSCAIVQSMRCRLHVSEHALEANVKCESPIQIGLGPYTLRTLNPEHRCLNP